MTRGERKKHSLRKTYKIKKRKPIYRSKIFWFSTLFVILVAIAVYFLVFFHYFWISTIDVLGTQRINSVGVIGEIQKEADNRLIFPSRSIFLFSITATEDKLKKLYPAIEEIVITKKLPNVLAINIRERSTIALWLNNQRFYQIDKFGIIFEEALSEDRLVIRPKQDNLSINIGDLAVKEKIMETIIQIDRSMKIDSGLVVREAVIDNNGQITIVTTGGFDVYFETKNDINWQLTKLNAVLEKQIPVARRGELEYIDVRFGNLAPYRYRNSSD